MNDLISRSALLEEFGEEPYCWFEYDDAEMQQHNDWLYYTDCVKKAPAVDAVEVVRCENCTHQQKVWHDDKRMKEGGFFIYSCKLNEDPFVTHVVNGNPSEFCCLGKRRVEHTITTATLKLDEIFRFEDLEQEV